jgi:hypothetical protein
MLLVAPTELMTIPSPLLPEITLRSEASRPPIVLLAEPLSMSMPSSPLPNPAISVPAAFVPM